MKAKQLTTAGRRQGGLRPRGNMERELGNPLDNPKHEAFAQEVAKGKTLCKAYVLAGYADDRGKRLEATSNYNNQRSYQGANRRGGGPRRRFDRTCSQGVSQDRFLQPGRLRQSIGRGRISRVTPEQFAAIGEVQTDTIGDVSRVKLKLLDKLRALNDLGRHLGMFVDKTETKVDGMIVVDPRAGKL